jgi:hypothetical protein
LFGSTAVLTKAGPAARASTTTSQAARCAIAARSLRPIRQPGERKRKRQLRRCRRAPRRWLFYPRWTWPCATWTREACDGPPSPCPSKPARLFETGHGPTRTSRRPLGRLLGGGGQVFRMVLSHPGTRQKRICTVGSRCTGSSVFGHTKCPSPSLATDVVWGMRDYTGWNLHALRWRLRT